MAKLTLLRTSTKYDSSIQSYRMILEITAAEEIDKNVFVAQRIRDYVKNNFEDVFAAVATPAQIEDFDRNSPAEGTSFFRTSKVDIVTRNAAYLEEVFASILRELQKLVDDFESLNLLIPDGIYTIEADNIEVNTAVVHTHYRLPLYARPSGENEVYDDSGTDRQRVASQDTDLPGWLNTTGGDPTGYKFKYNIAQDASLSALWPPTADKLAYAHLELNGISINSAEVRITADGIYWKPDEAGSAPWPLDYVSPSNTGADQYQKTLVLDFII